MFEHSTDGDGGCGDIGEAKRVWDDFRGFKRWYEVSRLGMMGKEG